MLVYNDFGDRDAIHALRAGDHEAQLRNGTLEFDDLEVVLEQLLRGLRTCLVRLFQENQAHAVSIFAFIYRGDGKTCSRNGFRRVFNSKITHCCIVLHVAHIFERGLRRGLGSEDRAPVGQDVEVDTGVTILQEILRDRHRHFVAVVPASGSRAGMLPIDVGNSSSAQRRLVVARSMAERPYLHVFKR